MGNISDDSDSESVGTPLSKTKSISKNHSTKNMIGGRKHRLKVIIYSHKIVILFSFLVYKRAR
jgi:hypothetical protein